MLTTILIVQWVFILALLVAVLALAQQVGLLHSRMGPVGARVVPVGPGIGEEVERHLVDDLGGTAHEVGGQRDGLQLLVFMSTSCSSCERLVPGLRSFIKDEHGNLDLDIVLAFLSSDPSTVAKYVRENRLHGPTVIAGTELPHFFRVNNAPFALLLNPRGQVVAKGVVNTREQLDSLLSEEALKAFANLVSLTDPESPVGERSAVAQREV